MPFLVAFFSRFFVTFFGRASAWLIGLVVTLVPGLVQSVIKLFGRLAKIALVLTAIFTALFAFSAAVESAFSSISGFFVPQEFFEVGAMFLPGNLSMCLSIVVMARIKSLIFMWVVRLSEKFERA